MFLLLFVLLGLWYLPRWFMDDSGNTVQPKPEEFPPPPTKTPEVGGPVTETGLPPQIFALIIAIDSYMQSEPGASFPMLRGCVADANDIVEMLKETFRVPTDRITKLYGEDATRERIISAFESLAQDIRIPTGAVIMIFYAGHGGEILSDISGEKIQMLVPHDFKLSITDTHPVATNTLEDYKIGELLTKIADSKGNNITVILDCCHSGSGTRDAGSESEEMGTPRSVQLPIGTRLAKSTPFTSSASVTARGATIREEDKNRFLGSHVVLEACHQTEHAYERDGRGAFTRALTTLLRSFDLQQLTSSDVVERLPPLPNQTPQCDGVNKDRIFLTNKDPEPRPILYRVTKNSNGTYELNAGDAHGIIRDAEFAMYGTNACTEELCRLRASAAEALTSTLVPIDGGLSFEISETAFARQTHIGAVEDVHLFVELDSHLASVFASIQQEILWTAAHRPFFRVASSPEEKPDLIITAIEPECTTARFEINDIYCRGVGLKEIPYHPSTDQQTMTRILCGAANFYWYLHCRRTENDIITSIVDFECYELSEGINMRAAGDNLFRCGVIRIPFTGQLKPYGFRLDNNSHTPLFVSMFFFNVSDLSIHAVYQPSAAGDGNHRPSLGSNGSLTIGYGTGGALPLSFHLEDDLDVDVVYLKIFLSTRYIDYRMLPQVSPFLGGGRWSFCYASRVSTWGTMLIPVVQVRQGV